MPKVIHYCWFGPNSLPDTEQKCIESWIKQLPGYQLKLWNERNFDVNANEFSTQAYEKGAFAFVSDYARTKVLYEYGGLYLDTDVEILDHFDDFLYSQKSFLGFETRSKIGTAVMYFTPKHPVMAEFLNFYERNKFIDDSGNLNTIANVSILTDILVKKGLTVDGTRQEINGIEVYPRERFYPKKIANQKFLISDDTVAIHRCSNSWMTEREKVRGNSPFWINIMRPLLRGLRTTGKRLVREDIIQKIEIQVRNKLK